MQPALQATEEGWNGTVLCAVGEQQGKVNTECILVVLKKKKAFGGKMIWVSCCSVCVNLKYC